MVKSNRFARYKTISTLISASDTARPKLTQGKLCATLSVTSINHFWAHDQLKKNKCEKTQSHVLVYPTWTIILTYLFLTRII